MLAAGSHAEDRLQWSSAERGVPYDLLFTSDLGQPFAVIETVTADAVVVERALPANGNGFYAVRQRR